MLILERKINGVRAQDQPRRNWIDDIKEQTNAKEYSELKRSIYREDRKR